MCSLPQPTLNPRIFHCASHCCEPTAPHSHGRGAFAVAWVPHMAALGQGLGYPQPCILGAGGGLLCPVGGWVQGVREEGSRPPSPFGFQRPEQ